MTTVPIYCDACTQEGRPNAISHADTRLTFANDGAAFAFCREHLDNFQTNWRDYGGRRDAYAIVRQDQIVTA